MTTEGSARTLPKNIRDELAEFACALRGSHPSVPVLLRPICEALQVRVQRTASVENGKAYLSWDRSRHRTPTILLPVRAHKTWDRFCSAHELGHYFLLSKYDWAPDDGPSYWRTEELCDFFARELLLPRESINRSRFEESARNSLRHCDSTAAEALLPWKEAATAISEATSAFFLVLDTSTRGGMVVASSSLPQRRGTKSELPSDSACVSSLREFAQEAGTSRATLYRQLPSTLFSDTKLGSMLSKRKVRELVAAATPRSSRLKIAGLSYNG